MCIYLFIPVAWGSERKVEWNIVFVLACHVACRILVSQGLNPCPLQWKHGVVITGSPGNSHHSFFSRQSPLKINKQGKKTTTGEQMSFFDLWARRRVGTCGRCLESPIFCLNYLRLLELLIFLSSDPKHNVGKAMLNGGCLPALWGVTWCSDQVVSAGRMYPWSYTEPQIQVNKYDGEI